MFFFINHLRCFSISFIHLYKLFISITYYFWYNLLFFIVLYFFVLFFFTFEIKVIIPLNFKS